MKQELNHLWSLIHLLHVTGKIEIIGGKSSFSIVIQKNLKRLIKKNSKELQFSC